MLQAPVIKLTVPYNLLTAQDCVFNLPEAIFLECHMDVIEASQLPGVVLPVNVLQHWNGTPIGHGSLS